MLMSNAARFWLFFPAFLSISLCCLVQMETNNREKDR